MLRGEKEENETSAQITENGSLQCNKRDEEAATHDPIEGSMVGSQRKVHGKLQDSAPLLRFLLHDKSAKNDVLVMKLNDDVLYFL